MKAELIIFSLITIFFVLISCSTVDTRSPADVIELTAIGGDKQVVLTWSDPSDDDLDKIVISYSPGDGLDEVLAGIETLTITGLTNGTEYTFTVKAVDKSGNKSSGTSATCTPVDTTAPADVTGLTAVEGDTSVVLTWTDPSDSDFDKVEITYTGVTTPVEVDEGIGTATISNLTNGTEYTFTVKAIDELGNKSTGVTVSCTPASSLSVIFTAQSSGVTTALNAVYFVDANTGWAVGENNVILHTSDAGSTWIAQTSPLSSSVGINDIYFINSNNGFAVGDSGNMLKTSDGGVTWLNEADYTSNINAFHFVDSDTGWFAHNNGNIYKTTNGGTDSTLQNSGLSVSIEDIYFVDANNGWAIAYGGIIIGTTDGGATWTTQADTSIAQGSAIHFISSTVGFAVGNWYLAKTTDGGSNWTTDTISNGGSYSDLYAIHFGSSTVGAMAGRTTSGYYGDILVTNDGGSTWIAQEDDAVNNKIFYSIHFANASTAWLVGTSGTIVKMVIQ